MVRVRVRVGVRVRDLGLGLRVRVRLHCQQLVENNTRGLLGGAKTAARAAACVPPHHTSS
jgi:hypothetical protein